MTATEISELLKERFGDKVLEVHEDDLSAWTKIDRDAYVEACTFLRDDANADLKVCHDLTVVDRLQHFEVVLHLYSVDKKHAFAIRTNTESRENVSCPSVTSVWPAAESDRSWSFRNRSCESSHNRGPSTQCGMQKKTSRHPASRQRSESASNSGRNSICSVSVRFVSMASMRVPTTGTAFPSTHAVGSNERTSSQISSRLVELKRERTVAQRTLPWWCRFR